ncbi:MAG: hypothetical protein ABJN84_08185 [Flavobacteriaceae bacterium]
MKKWVKFLLFILLPIVILIVALFSYGYYNYWGKFPLDEEKYPNYIGYINQDAALLNDKYELCGDKEIYFTYNGAAYRAFQGNKSHFKKYILKTYENKGYSDSGYLNFRFLVNCEGNPGWFEIIQMDLDLNERDLNKYMVRQLLTLTSKPEHWNTLSFDDNPINYYMYISYRIEDGEIFEILP